jgi:hypothetical protein
LSGSSRLDSGESSHVAEEIAAAEIVRQHRGPGLGGAEYAVAAVVDPRTKFTVKMKRAS